MLIDEVENNNLIKYLIDIITIGKYPNVFDLYFNQKAKHY